MNGVLHGQPPAFLIAPAALVAGAILLPLAYLLIRGLDAGPEVWELLLRERALVVFLQSLVLVVSVTAAALVVAVPLAWLTTRTDLPFKKVWSILFVLPLVVPSYVGAYTVIAALGPRGILAEWTESFLGRSLVPDIYGLPGALFTLAAFTYPYVYLTVSAALRRLDPALEESSRMLGYGPAATFFRVVLPQLSPAIGAGSLLVALYTLSDFGAVSLLQYDSFTRLIYVQYQNAFDRTFAAVLSLVLSGLMLAILLLESRLRQAGRFARLGSGAARPAAIVPLGVWRWPALGLSAFVVLISLIMPVAVVVFWAVRGLRSGEALIWLFEPALHSVQVSGLAAAAAILAAIPVSILIVRYPTRQSLLLERLSYTGYALPGIVVALALVFFGIRYAFPLYQSLALLILAYVILFLPQAIGSVQTSLRQVNPHLEEASRMLGRSAFQAVREVTIPLVRPGIAAGLALVFLTAMKELPATLILSPIGYKTLATAVWSATEEGFFARAAVPILLMLLTSSLSLLFILREQS